MDDEKPKERPSALWAWSVAWGFLLLVACTLATFGVGVWTVGKWIFNYLK